MFPYWTAFIFKFKFIEQKTMKRISYVCIEIKMMLMFLLYGRATMQLFHQILPKFDFLYLCFVFVPITQYCVIPFFSTMENLISFSAEKTLWPLKNLNIKILMIRKCFCCFWLDSRDEKNKQFYLDVLAILQSVCMWVFFRRFHFINFSFSFQNSSYLTL